MLRTATATRQRLQVFLCILQAEARQSQYEQSAVGKAAYKAVKKAKEPAPAAERDTTKDWLT